MQMAESVTSMVESFRENASVRTVYGEPIASGERTIVPVAKVSYGFGGGYGSGTAEGDAGAGAATDAERTSEGGGEGGGLGGGFSASPVGVVEIGRGQTRLIRFDRRRRLAWALLGGALVGYLLGRRSGKSNARR